MTQWNIYIKIYIVTNAKITQWCDSLTSDTTHWLIKWLIHLWRVSFTCDSAHNVWQDSFIRDSVMCDLTHWHVIRRIDASHDSFICNSSLSHMTHYYVTRLIHMRRASYMCDSAHNLWHDSFIRDSVLCDLTHGHVTRRIDGLPHYMTHSFVTRLFHSWLINLWHTSFTHDSLIRDKTHSHMTRWYVTRLVHMWNDSLMWGMTLSRVTWCVVWLFHVAPEDRQTDRQTDGQTDR